MPEPPIPDETPSAAPFPLRIPIRDDAWRSWGIEELVALARARGRRWALRTLAGRAAERLDADAARKWHPGELIALSLLTEAGRQIVLYYGRQEPDALERGLTWVDAGAPGAPTSASLDALAARFPGAEALARDGRARELIDVRLLMENPAASPYRPLFDDAPVREAAPAPALVTSLEGWFGVQPPVADLGLTLFEVLRAPVRAHPGSLRLQLEYVIRHFGKLLPAWLFARLRLAGDILAEEQAARGLGPAESRALTFEGGAWVEDERFTRDADWMSNVVLIAKSTYVWLDQLSRRYGRDIRRLDAIPDEELDRLAGWGFTGLWLIGVWERSPASRTIKQWRGNPEALASAYSLYDYVIAHELGGEDAWRDLDRRARARGIRLATDMVPNHTGLDSRWIVEHPDRFLALDEPPYPNYRFTGADLCGHPDVSVHLEDGYWDSRDAAVVFKHHDHRSGRTRYIYHGNDGTSMPWNDTAQIDYLNPEAREAVIRTILAVARRSQIIRFDAAMTLAKRHIRRLWFPAPGEGGAIPSRAEHGLTPEDFDRAIPVEFWREVVDRVQTEAPDTLLLAEAFWMMEGYFVRTLGMHRVYNSAFMNMLRNEDNAEYRRTLKNVLSFSAEVLKRFVNFLNNPDEETAVEQFGKGDKYFGVATMMVTQPGLPMLGHGQIEGLGEKYGMEYARAYRDEPEDAELVARHERQIFPLMRHRRLFSQVDGFVLYDVAGEDGGVCEDVFAYSNRAGDERAIVVYNNRYAETAGWIRQGAPTRRGGTDAPLTAPTLGEALGIGPDTGLIALRDHVTGLWLLRAARELCERGLFVRLRAYETQVLVDFRVLPAEGAWADLAWRLGGAGVPDLDAARRYLELEPLRDALWSLVAEDADPAGAIAWLAAAGRLDDAASGAACAGLRTVARAKLEGADAKLARGLAVCRALPAETVERGGLAAVVVEAAGGAVDETAFRVLVGAPDGSPRRLVEHARDYLRVHEHGGVRWFDGDRMEMLLRGWPAAAAVLAPGPDGERATVALRRAVAASRYRMDELLAALAAAPSRERNVQKKARAKKTEQKTKTKAKAKSTKAKTKRKAKTKAKAKSKAKAKKKAAKKKTSKRKR